MASFLTCRVLIAIEISSSPGMARPPASAYPMPTGLPMTARDLRFATRHRPPSLNPLDFTKLDVVTYSWQKVLGGEAAHGMLILSPHAVARLESYTPPWPLPKIFRLTKAGKLIDGIFRGETINTPSMLCVEDYVQALEWADGLGELSALIARADANAAAIAAWVERTDWVEFLAADPQIRSNTSVCLKLANADASPDIPKRMAKLLEQESAALDIGGYRDAPPGLRIWCGATVETSDIEALLPWLDWAYATASQS